MSRRLRDAVGGLTGVAYYTEDGSAVIVVNDMQILAGNELDDGELYWEELTGTGWEEIAL